MLIVPIDDIPWMTSSYVDSMCDLLSDVVVCCSFKALISAFPLVTIIQHMTITVMETTRLTIRTAAREMMDIMDAWLICVSRFIKEARFTEIVLLVFLVILPQLSATVCTANVHALPVGTNTSVQVTLVWLVVVGQLPQFDDRML